MSSTYFEHQHSL